jgi:hypothetical protein
MVPAAYKIGFSTRPITNPVPIFFYRARRAGINPAVQVIEKPARFETFQHLQRFEEMISLVGAAVRGEYFRRRAGQLTSGLILVASAKAAFASPISPRRPNVNPICGDRSDRPCISYARDPSRQTVSLVGVPTQAQTRGVLL